ncbi:MAG: hypothetical protein FJ255_06765 [Phycisphaerae bacterium]|nr:hypothetical protein [Phycisphaerae bacterium]
MLRSGIVGAVSLVVSAGAAFGQNYAEVGDAGDLPGTAQVAAGSGPLTSLSGTNAASDADLFVIDICFPGNFSATTVGSVTWDTQLWLFHADGRGIVHNDDAPTGTLQSRLTNLFTSSLTPGRYILGISRYNRDPVNSTAALIWANTPFNVERAPDGPGATAGDIVVSAWTGTHTTTGTYTIALTGACFVSTCPGTGTGACSRADWNEDGTIDFNDMLAFLNTFNAQDLCADLNADGAVDFNDFLAFLNLFNVGC